MPKFSDLAGTLLPFRFRPYTVATLPSASANPGRVVDCTDALWSGGTGCLVRSNGANWLDPNGKIASTAASAQQWVEAFTWAGSALVLSRTPVGAVLVFVAGTAQIPGDVTVVGKSITALANVVTGDTVLAIYWGI